MKKVVKFGGSSLASAEQFQKVADIIHAQEERRYVIPSAPGKRFDGDSKVTDMLYGCYHLAEAGEDFEKELAEEDPGFTPGRQRMCPELIHRFSGQFRGIDSILYLAEEFQERSGEMPLKEELLRKLHYFFYLGEKTERYTVLEENLWNGYGMPLMPVKEAGELATCRIRRLLVLDDRQEGEADWRALPSGCVYMDLWSDPGRKKQIAGNRVDIKYISEYLYLVQNLDTTGENGYNVREGNEQCQQK